MKRCCQVLCGNYPELSVLIFAIPHKVPDSGIRLSVGASGIHAVQRGEPPAQPLHLQPEEQGGEGSSEEGADQKFQADLLTQTPLPHREEKLRGERGAGKSQEELSPLSGLSIHQFLKWKRWLLSIQSPVLNRAHKET